MNLISLGKNKNRRKKRDGAHPFNKSVGDSLKLATPLEQPNLQTTSFKMATFAFVQHLIVVSLTLKCDSGISDSGCSFHHT